MPRLYRRKCSSNERISKKTVIAMLAEGSKQREWLESIDESQWTVTSFNSNQREVCVEVQTDSRVNRVTFKLPELSSGATGG